MYRSGRDQPIQSEILETRTIKARILQIDIIKGHFKIINFRKLN